jgi:hypothetical protein
MPAFDLHIVFDCADPDRVARFWMAALGGYDFRSERLDEVDGYHVIMRDPEGNEFCLA